MKIANCAILFYSISSIEMGKWYIITYMQEIPHKAKAALKAFWRAPLWIVIVGTAVLGILLLSIWPNLSVQLVLINLLSLVVFVRLLAAKGIFAWIVKVAVIIWVLLYWLAKMAGY